MRRLILPVILFTLVLAGPCAADDLIWATGRVFTADGRQPLRDAMVAVYDEKNKVIDYAKTDSDGNYTLALPRSALRISKQGGRGFLHRVATGVTRVVGGLAGPLKLGLRAAANAAPVSGEAAYAAVNITSGVAQNLVDAARPKKDNKPVQIPPGTLVMKVSLPGHNDALALASVYWLQEEIYRTGRKEQRVLTAWFDPVLLTAAGAKEPSVIASDYLVFTDARLEPSIAEPGQTVIINVMLPSPPEPRTPVTVVARNAKTGRTIELHPAGNGRYRGEMLIDKKNPRDDQLITVLAYAQQSDQAGRSKEVEKALEKAGLWSPEKPFVYNPLLVVSRNRAEMTLTVVEPARKPRGAR